MRTAEILLDEHRCISDMLGCLEKLAEDVKRGEQIDPLAAAELLILFDSFADGVHQRKEEEILFPLLLERAGAPEAEVLQELVDDHHEEWSRMQQMRGSLHQALSGEPESKEEFLGLATSYVELQRDHIVRENQALIGMIERLMSPEDDERVAAGFHELEVTEVDVAGVFEEVRSLCKRLGLKAAC